MPPFVSQPPTEVVAAPPSYVLPHPKDAPERDAFYAKLHAFRDDIGEPIQRLPTLGFKELDLCVLYKEVIKRRGIDSVIAKKQWKEIAEALQLPSSCTDSGFRLRLHYKKYLEAFERKFFSPPPVQEPVTNPVERKTEKLSMSALSAASAVTDVAAENESVRSSGSRRSSGPVSTSEATSKEKLSQSVDLRHARITKKKKRSALVTPQNPATAHHARKEDGKDAQPSTDSVPPQGHLNILEAAAVAIERNNVRDKGRNRVDFSVLDHSTLKRYAEVYRMDEESQGNVLLADSVSAHFSATPLCGGEHETLLKFIEAVKRR